MGKKDKITRERKAKDLAISFTKKGGLFVFLNSSVKMKREVLKEIDSPFDVEVKLWEKGHEEETLKPLFLCQVCFLYFFLFY